MICQISQETIKLIHACRTLKFIHAVSHFGQRERERLKGGGWHFYRSIFRKNILKQIKA